MAGTCLMRCCRSLALTWKLSHCSNGPGASVRESIVLRDCTVAAGARLEGAILGPGVEVGEGALVSVGTVVGHGARIGAGVVVAEGGRIGPGEIVS